MRHPVLEKPRPAAIEIFLEVKALERGGRPVGCWDVITSAAEEFNHLQHVHPGLSQVLLVEFDVEDARRPPRQESPGSAQCLAFVTLDANLHAEDSGVAPGEDAVQRRQVRCDGRGSLGLVDYAGPSLVSGVQVHCHLRCVGCAVSPQGDIAYGVVVDIDIVLQAIVGDRGRKVLRYEGNTLHCNDSAVHAHGLQAPSHGDCPCADVGTNVHEVSPALDLAEVPAHLV
mmetsp:Transcript_5692/g.16503  ORF Transcript_5692/g.16503 Transcript_5692/m.16503 type:complete len:228 (+) Transcript_5692:3159-3842(+)